MSMSLTRGESRLPAAPAAFGKMAWIAEAAPDRHLSDEVLPFSANTEIYAEADEVVAF